MIYYQVQRYSCITRYTDNYSDLIERGFFMKYDEMIYRPPSEAYTLLLQVTSGCSHNKCSYCNMYKGVQFKTETLEQIEKDLIEAKVAHKDTKRIYLLNGDPFALSADRLKSIAKLIHKHLPNCETISMYASIDNIKTKTSQELKELRALGINDLYIGVETGSDPALEHINKGNTSKEAARHLKRLNEASVDFISIIMYGVAGQGKGIENALATGELLNSVRSKAIAVMNLTLIPGTDLYEEYMRGDFIQASEQEKLIEVKTLIENLHLKDQTLFSSIHMSNIESLNGILPRDKETFIDRLSTVIV